MAHSPEKKMELRAAYIGGLPLEQAAEKVGVPAGTARNWYREARDGSDDWDKFQRASLLVSGGGIEQALGRLIAAGLLRCESLLEKTQACEDPVEGVKSMAVLADTVAKLNAASKNMMPATDRLAVAMDLIKRLDTFVRDHAPQHAPAFAEILPPFGQEVAKAYG